MDHEVGNPRARVELKGYTMRMKIKFRDGEVKIWECWRDSRPPVTWNLRTHDGCERVVGGTWAESVTRINECADNYGGRFLNEVS